MPQQISSNLDTSVIGVLDTNGHLIGSGFVASERLIITCAHVIDDAQSGPGKTITVRFHFNGITQQAQILTEYWSDAEGDDIAVLQLDSELPPNVTPVILGEATGSAGNKFLSLGYPLVGNYVGIWASGQIERLVSKESERRMLQLSSSQIAQGHSGAPVWDEAYKRVVGMVSEVYHPGQDSKNRDTAFATPTETLWRVCPELIQPRTWPIRAVEFNKLLGITQPINHLQLERGSTINLRHGDVLDRLDGPFDELAHTIDVRRIDSEHTRGRYNIQNLGLIVWRLKLYSVTQTPAYCLEEVGPHCYLFNVLGIDTVLYKRPQPETELTNASSELNLLLSRRTLEMDLRGKTESRYYGENKSLAIWVDNRPEEIRRDKERKPNEYFDRQPIPSNRIISADLSDWQYVPPMGYIAIDPTLGRIAFPPRQIPRSYVGVSYYYGFSADIGGGEYDRPLLQPADPKLYQVGKREEFRHIHNAISKWMLDQPKNAVIEIMDSGVYVEIINIELNQNQSLQIRAANRTRPIIRQLHWQTDVPDALFVALAPGSHFTLDGIHIVGFGVKVDTIPYEPLLPIHPTADEAASVHDDESTTIKTDYAAGVAELNIRHCTLVPGWALRHDWEPKYPYEPSLELFDTEMRLNIEHSIIGPIRIHGSHNGPEETDPMPIQISDSILDATSSKLEVIDAPNNLAAYSILTIKRCTVFGMVDVYSVELAENCIFNDYLKVEQQDEGQIQFCHVPYGSYTPRQHSCQPDLAERAAEKELLKLNRNAPRIRVETVRARARERVLPQFTNRRYGQPGYAQLADICADEIKLGANDTSEMGVFHNLYQNQLVANLQKRLDGYSEAGRDVGIIYAS